MNNTLESYKNSPLFQEALLNFQKGEWEPGLERLSELMKAYPLETELRNLRAEMYLRSTIDADEIQDDKQAKTRSLIVKSARVLLVLLVIGLVYVSGSLTYNMIRRSIDESTKRINDEIAKAQLATEYRNAQNFYIAGRTEEALAIFEKLADDPLFQKLAQDNEIYQGINIYLPKAQQGTDLDALYDEAMQFKNDGSNTEALAIFKQINDKDPIFKDVADQIAEIEQYNLLDSKLADANASFNKGDWNDAIVKYSDLRDQYSFFKPETIEDGLFKSYLAAAQSIMDKKTNVADDLTTANNYFLKALALRPRDPEALALQDKVIGVIKERLFWNYVNLAQSILSKGSDSLDALKQADDYFKAALALKPGDAEIENQRMMAELYVQAQSDFTKGAWNDVITNMSQVVAIQMDYANGTARQTLYEAYVARAGQEMSTAQFQMALEDYRKAEILARQDPNAIMRLYEIEVNFADALGTMGQYQEALVMYASAVEITDLKNRLETDKPDVVAKIERAELYTRWGNYMTAFNTYHDALKDFTVFATVLHKVTEGEYLNQLANEYGTTVSAIRIYNNLDQYDIAPGTEIKIPVITP